MHKPSSGAAIVVKRIMLCCLGLAVFGSVATAQISDELVKKTYGGSWREEAKTSFSAAKAEPCGPLADLIVKLPADVDIRNKYPAISEKPTTLSGRVAEEERNVCAVGYITAVRMEDGRGENDNDFTFVFSTGPAAGAGRMRVEVTGLPKSGDTAPFEAARRQYLALMEKAKFNSAGAEGAFRPLTEPLKVQISGSLFFNGRRSIRPSDVPLVFPETVWEIHPVRAIKTAP